MDGDEQTADEHGTGGAAEEHHIPGEPRAPGSLTPPSGPASPEPPGGGPPWARGGAAATPGWTPFGASSPPTTEVPTAGPAAPGASPYGPPAAPTAGAPGAPGGFAGPPQGFAGPPAGFAGGSPGAVAPGVPGVPGVGTPAVGVPVVPAPVARRSERRTLGLPPGLGLATAFMSFPAVAAFMYGIFAILAGLVFAGSDSSSSDEFGVDMGDIGAGFAAGGFVLLIVGAIGIYGVVMVMAANAIGRTVCTVFLVLGVIGALLATVTGGAFTLVFAVPYYTLCFWALWGRPGRSVF